MPIETLTPRTGPAERSSSASSMRSAAWTAACEPVSGSRIANSSPPIRQARSWALVVSEITPASATSTLSPAP